MAKTVTVGGRTYKVGKGGGVSKVSKSGRSSQVVGGREASRARNKAGGGSGG